jgi:hypothetical protein
MVSQRRCAQFGLILACLTLATMLTILFFGSYGDARGERRFGTIAQRGEGNGTSSGNVKMAAVSK